jgi:hypothetical protein
MIDGELDPCSLPFRRTSTIHLAEDLPFISCGDSSPKNQFKAQELEAENVVRKFDPGLVMSTGWSQSPNRALANDTFRLFQPFVGVLAPNPFYDARSSRLAHWEYSAQSQLGCMLPTLTRFCPSFRLLGRTVMTGFFTTRLI